jgi:hypothetical protein
VDADVDQLPHRNRELQERKKMEEILPQRSSELKSESRKLARKVQKNPQPGAERTVDQGRPEEAKKFHGRYPKLGFGNSEDSVGVDQP